MDGWASKPEDQNCRSLGRLPTPQTLANSPLTPPHPSESAGRNPMRVAPPRAPAPPPRNYLPLGTPTATQRRRPSQPRGCFPPYLPPPRPRLFHPTPRGGRRIPRRCGAPRRRARAARTRLLRGAHHRCMGRSAAVRFAPGCGGNGGAYAAPSRSSSQRWLLLLLPRAASPCAGGVALKTASTGSDEGRRRVVDGCLKEVGACCSKRVGNLLKQASLPLLSVSWNWKQ